jgi:hypothetical protein
VRAIQHVFQRGAVFWWRRRLIKTGESNLTLTAISRRTREPLVARTIAAHITLESDRILRQERRSMLSTSCETVARTRPLLFGLKAFATRVSQAMLDERNEPFRAIATENRSPEFEVFCGGPNGLVARLWRE